MASRRRKWSVALLLMLAAIAAAFVWPVRTGELESHPRPAVSYDEAIARLDSLRALDTDDVNPLCRTELMTHGGRAARVVVFLHGLTNCPRQFHRLGELCFAHGDNVLLVRLPCHGFADRMSPALAGLTARELATFTDRIADIADGLGGRVTIAGLSAGGVMAAWAGQNRADVDCAVVIAPSLNLPGVPGPLTAAATNLMLLAPNRFFWWDDKRREGVLGPRYCYPRYATHAVGEVLRLARAVDRQAARARPLARSIVLVTNANDHAVENRTVEALADGWRRRGAASVTSYRFPVELKLGHDLIDPEQPYQRVEITYPILVNLAEPHIPNAKKE